jgi:CBS domain-containing protein
MLTIRDVMSPAVLTVASSDSVTRAAQALARARISGAAVRNETGVLIGVVSQADLTNAGLVGTRRHPTVSDVMTPDAIGVYVDDPALAAALEMARHDIHRVLVWDADGDPVGFVSSLDLVKAIARGARFAVGATATAERQSSQTAREVMTPVVVTMAADDSVASAAARLAEAAISGAPVRDGNGKLVGIVSQTDLLDPRRGGGRPNAAVYEVMTPEVFTVYADGPALVAALVMAKYDIHRVAVSDATGTLVGILTSLDLVKALARGVRLESRTGTHTAASPVRRNVNA